MNNVADCFSFFGRVAHLFSGRFLKPLWDKYPNRENDTWEALLLFLDGYAFARQGAKNDFIHAACDSIYEQKKAGRTLTDSNAVDRIWDSFSALLKNADLNHAVNPLCPKGTRYTRTYKGVPKDVRTGGLSVLEFVRMLEERCGSANIITYGKRNLEAEELRQVYQALSGGNGINGIGGKIASLFLRDVATFYDVFPSANRYLLQPIDVWVRRISTQLMGAKAPDNRIARWIVREAARSSVNAEMINQGMWYFGSQVGGSEYRTSRALNDLTYAEALVKEHVESLREAVSVWVESVERE